MYNVLQDRFRGVRLPRRRRRIPDQYRHLYSFAVVRNPYDRMVSWWWAICKNQGDRYGHKKQLRNMGLTESLKDFLILFEDKGRLGQHIYFEVNTINQTLRLEQLEEDFSTLPFIHEKIKFPKSNSKNPKEYSV